MLSHSNYVKWKLRIPAKVPWKNAPNMLSAVFSHQAGLCPLLPQGKLMVAVRPSLLDSNVPALTRWAIATVCISSKPKYQSSCSSTNTLQRNQTASDILSSAIIRNDCTGQSSVPVITHPQHQKHHREDGTHRTAQQVYRASRKTQENVPSKRETTARAVCIRIRRAFSHPYMNITASVPTSKGLIARYHDATLRSLLTLPSLQYFPQGRIPPRQSRTRRHAA
jgi:hypothetical protein